MRKTFPIALGFLWAGMALAADAPAEWKAVQVAKIWDQAPHNAFTDLIRFRDQWYCSFREGKGHASGAGTMRVLSSMDGVRWESAALLETPDIDLRDPKLCLTPDGRLMIVGGAAEPAARNPVKDHYSVVSFSRDGKKWSKPQRVLDSWQWLWRVTWHKGTAYGVAYAWDPKMPSSSKGYSAFLARSADGLKWEKVADFKIPNPTEATLAFDGDTMHCLQRRDGKPNTAMLGTSRAPYTEWTWQDLGSYYGGPNFLRLDDGSWWATGRLIQGGKAQTVVCGLDIKAGKLRPVVTLPSGGDTSYPGMVWHQNELWVSYYSSHEGKTSIYLARLQRVKP